MTNKQRDAMFREAIEDIIKLAGSPGTGANISRMVFILSALNHSILISFKKDLLLDIANDAFSMPQSDNDDAFLQYVMALFEDESGGCAIEGSDDCVTMVAQEDDNQGEEWKAPSAYFASPEWLEDVTNGMVFKPRQNAPGQSNPESDDFIA